MRCAIAVRRAPSRSPADSRLRLLFPRPARAIFRPGFLRRYFMRVSVAALGLSVCLAVASCGKSDNGKTVVYSGNNGTVTATQSGNGEHVVVHSASGNE